MVGKFMFTLRFVKGEVTAKTYLQNRYRVKENIMRTIIYFTYHKVFKRLKTDN